MRGRSCRCLAAQAEGRALGAQVASDCLPTPQGLNCWLDQFVSGARSTPNTVSSSTFAPFSMSPGRENSLGEWLIPPTLGMKIMPIGPRLAISCASCAAPLGMAIAPLKVRRKRQDEPPALLGQHRVQARHVEPAGVGQVKAIKPDSPRMRPQGPMI